MKPMEPQKVSSFCIKIYAKNQFGYVALCFDNVVHISFLCKTYHFNAKLSILV